MRSPRRTPVSDPFGLSAERLYMLMKLPHGRVFRTQTFDLAAVKKNAGRKIWWSVSAVKDGTPSFVRYPQGALTRSSLCAWRASRRSRCGSAERRTDLPRTGARFFRQHLTHFSALHLLRIRGAIPGGACDPATGDCRLSTPEGISTHLACSREPHRTVRSRPPQIWEDLRFLCLHCSAGLDGRLAFLGVSLLPGCNRPGHLFSAGRSLG